MISVEKSIESTPQNVFEMEKQNWAEIAEMKIKKLRKQNATLESERDYYRQLYEKAVSQKEEIRRKAKDAVRLMRAIYSDYEELQEILRSKEQAVQRLTDRIKQLEGKDRSDNDSCADIVRLVSDGSSSPISIGKKHVVSSSNGTYESEEVFVREAKPKPKLQPISTEEDSDTVQATSFHVGTGAVVVDSVLSEECASLRARVAELEGILIGTLYFSARQDSQRITPKEVEPFTPSKRADPRNAVSKMIESLMSASQKFQDDHANSVCDAMDQHISEFLSAEESFEEIIGNLDSHDH